MSNETPLTVPKRGPAAADVVVWCGVLIAALTLPWVSGIAAGESRSYRTWQFPWLGIPFLLGVLAIGATFLFERADPSSTAPVMARRVLAVLCGLAGVVGIVAVELTLSTVQAVADFLPDDITVGATIGPACWAAIAGMTILLVGCRTISSAARPVVAVAGLAPAALAAAGLGLLVIARYLDGVNLSGSGWDASVSIATMPLLGPLTLFGLLPILCAIPMLFRWPVAASAIAALSGIATVVFAVIARTSINAASGIVEHLDISSRLPESAQGIASEYTPTVAPGVGWVIGTVAGLLVATVSLLFLVRCVTRPAPSAAVAANPYPVGATLDDPWAELGSADGQGPPAVGPASGDEWSSWGSAPTGEAHSSWGSGWGSTDPNDW